MPHIPPPSPWKAFGEPEPEHEYLIVLTHLPVSKLSALPKFLGYVRRIRKQLEARPEGLLGYSLLAKPFSSNYWTLSAWEDTATMGRFLREPPHSDAMEELPKVLSDFRTTRWKASGSALPPSWDESLARERLEPSS